MRSTGLRSIQFQLHNTLGYLLGLALICLLFTAASAAALPLSTPSIADEAHKLVKQARKQTRNGELAEAEKTLRSALSIEAGSVDAKLALAFVYVKQHRLGDAYDIAFKVAEADRQNARAFSVLGTALLAGGRFAEARLVFINALTLDEEEHLSVAGLGMIDFYENRINDSLVRLYNAKSMAPNEPDYLFAFAQVAARAERYNDAADAYTEFLRISHVADADRRARIKGLVSFLSYLGSQEGLYLPGGKDQSAVAIDLVGNRPIITLTINERSEPLRFVLDTGSGISVMSDVAAKRMKVKSITKGGYAKGIGGDGRFEIVYGFLRNVNIGDVKIRNVPIYIRKFHNDGQQPNVDGYIGLALISKFLTTIDYGSRKFSLTRKADDARDFRAQGEVSLPLRLTSSGFLSGAVELEGVESPLNFIVDTGASVSVISDRVANLKTISTFVNEEKLRVVGAAGITGDVPTFLLPRITFGTHTRRSVVAVALDLDMINEASGFEQAGILGGNFLKNYRLTFDFKNSKVTFTPLNPEN